MLQILDQKLMENRHVVQQLNQQQLLLQGLPLEFLWLLIILIMLIKAIRALPIILESTCGVFTRYKTFTKKKIVDEEISTF